MIENVKKNQKNNVDVQVRLPNLTKTKKVKIETNAKVAMIVIKREINIKTEEIVVKREKVDKEVEVMEGKKTGKIKSIKQISQKNKSKRYKLSQSKLSR
jgi:hypothetical protein